MNQQSDYLSNFQDDLEYSELIKNIDEVIEKLDYYNQEEKNDDARKLLLVKKGIRNLKTYESNKQKGSKRYRAYF